MMRQVVGNYLTNSEPSGSPTSGGIHDSNDPGRVRKKLGHDDGCICEKRNEMNQVRKLGERTP